MWVTVHRVQGGAGWKQEEPIPALLILTLLLFHYWCCCCCHATTIAAAIASDLSPLGRVWRRPHCHGHAAASTHIHTRPCPHTHIHLYTHAHIHTHTSCCRRRRRVTNVSRHHTGTRHRHQPRTHVLPPPLCLLVRAQEACGLQGVERRVGERRVCCRGRCVGASCPHATLAQTNCAALAWLTHPRPLPPSPPPPSSPLPHFQNQHTPSPPLTTVSCTVFSHFSPTHIIDDLLEGRDPPLLLPDNTTSSLLSIPVPSISYLYTCPYLH